MPIRSSFRRSIFWIRSRVAQARSGWDRVGHHLGRPDLEHVVALLDQVRILLLERVEALDVHDVIDVFDSSLLASGDDQPLDPGSSGTLVTRGGATSLSFCRRR